MKKNAAVSVSMPVNQITPSVSDLRSDPPLITCHLILSEPNLTNRGDSWGPSGIPLHSAHQPSVWAMPSTGICTLPPRRTPPPPSWVHHQRRACAKLKSMIQFFLRFILELSIGPTERLMQNLMFLKNHMSKKCRGNFFGEAFISLTNAWHTSCDVLSVLLRVACQSNGSIEFQ